MQPPPQPTLRSFDEVFEYALGLIKDGVEASDAFNRALEFATPEARDETARGGLALRYAKEVSGTQNST